MYFKNIWNQLNLKKKVLILFLPLNTLSILLILLLSISLILKSGKQDMIENSTDKLILVSEQTDRILSNIQYNIKAFSTSSALRSAVCGDYPENTYGNYMFASAMHSSVYNIMDIGSFISDGYVHTYNGRIYHIKTGQMGVPTEEMMRFYDMVISQNGQIIMTSPRDKSGNSIFQISKSLIDIDTGKCLGILSFDIKESLFYDAYKSICEEPENSILLADENGVILSAKNRTLLQTPVPSDVWPLINERPKGSAILSWEDQRSILLTQTISTGNILVVYLAGYYKLFQEVFFLAFLLIGVGILVLVITFLLSRLLAQSLVRPISRLADYADEAGKGNFHMTMTIQSSDEIGFLALRFQNMSSNISQLTKHIYNEQNQKREYELKLLQAQINPHFLYNCLDNISSLITDSKNDTASSMLYHLGRYYRSILSKGRNIITIREELHLIRDYLEIQLIKTPSLFTYQIEIPEELKDSNMLKMLLQPIVENSVLHGFSGYRENGHIDITADCHADIITITVSDNGRGITQDTLDTLFCPNEISIPKHFGLRNVQERIQLKFGPSYGLSVSRRPIAGTLITLWFPKML